MQLTLYIDQVGTVRYVIKKKTKLSKSLLERIKKSRGKTLIRAAAEYTKLPG